MKICFAYHSVQKGVYEHAISPELFEVQISRLKKNFTVVRARELTTQTMGVDDVSNDANYASVTFDDGVLDVYQNAWPILKTNDVPFTIFVNTAFLSQGCVNVLGTKICYLGWEEIKEMYDSGLVSIESHTHTHPLLTQLSDEAIEEEFVTSKQILRERLGVESTVLAYPKGNYDERVKRITQKHFKAAFGGVGAVLSGDPPTDPYAIPRVIVSSNIGRVKFSAMLHPTYWRLKRIRDRLQGRN